MGIMQKAAKEKTFLLLMIALACVFATPAFASSDRVLALKNRAEIFLGSGQNRIERQAFGSAKHVENYDSRWEVASESSVAPKGGFGVSGLLSKIEKGVPDKTIQEFYQAAASSSLFRKKLGLANLLSGGKKVSVDDILLQLQKNSKFRRIDNLGNARIDVTRNGTFVFRHSADTGLFSRATAHHELLHLAQFIRNPSLKTSARNLSFLQRQLYEPIPAIIGSPEIFGVPTLIVTGTGAYVVYESSGLIFELLDE